MINKKFQILYLLLQNKSSPRKMNETIINILQTSPTYIFEQDIEFSESATLKLLILSFDLILLSTLNHAKLPQITLFTLFLQQFFTEIKLKVSNQFDFYKLKYDSFLDLTCSEQFVSKKTVQIDNYNHDDKKVHKIKLTYDFKETQGIRLMKKTKIKFNFGNINSSDNSKHFGKFSISNFSWKLQNTKNLRKNEETQIALLNQESKLSVCNHQDEGGSFPIMYMNEYNNLKSEGQHYFSDLIKNLDPYKAPDTTSKVNHLFICHDMKDGYHEDTKFTNPVETMRSNSYRFNYFWYTGIFNYFSHKTISIPPKHWRQLCKRYQVKCLGTFIVENGRVNQNYYLTNQFALKLIYLAKKYKFDGYLINIENQIKDVEALKKWLAFLTNKIHQEIPGSMISWYDSVTTQGMVDYQNQINTKNKVFYDLTDSFYTNYWWNDEMLKKDLTQALPNKTIYVGNDVWGRGTFGGGQFNLYKAIDQIQKLNRPNQPNLVPALFAPGYTYESGGQNNIPFLKANQDKLYRGVNFDNYQLKDWVVLGKNGQSFQGPNKQKQWFVKAYSQNLWPYSNKNKIKIVYIYRTNPNISTEVKPFDYVICFNIQGNYHDTSRYFIEQDYHIGKVVKKDVKKLQIIVEANKITPKTDLQIIVATSVKDVFDDEKILVSYYLKNTDWVQEIPVSKLSLNTPYNSFFNMGHGDYFFYKGKKMLKNYNFLADYDLPPVLSLNHPFSTDIYDEDAFIGGSSLFIQETPIRLFYLELPNYQHSYAHSYQAKIVKKGGDIRSLNIVQSTGSSITFEKVRQNKIENDWIEIIYEISGQQMKKMRKVLLRDLQTSLMIDILQRCIIGQIYLQPKFIQNHPQQISKQTFEISISQSFRTKSSQEIFIDINLTQQAVSNQSNKNKLNHRYLIVIDEQFSAFIYMDKIDNFLFRGKLRQVKLRIKNGQNSSLKIYEIDSQFEEKLLLEQNDINFSSLKQYPLSHKINIKNY